MIDPIKIAGYTRGTNCAHCGRELVHGIKISTGHVVGADCLSKQMTLPKNFRGRHYRASPTRIKEMAVIIENCPHETWDKNYGITEWARSFELKHEVETNLLNN